jgi:hypothetical protein
MYSVVEAFDLCQKRRHVKKSNYICSVSNPRPTLLEKGGGRHAEKSNWNRPVSNPKPTLSEKGRHIENSELD